MPTTNNPSYYEHADGIAPGRADDFLKWIDGDYYTEYTGEVEAPVGYVALVKIDRKLIADYVTTFGDPWLSEARNFAPGWYIIKIDNNGLVWGMSYGGWCDEHQAFCADTMSEEKARVDFRSAAGVYAQWLDDSIDWNEGDHG